MSQDTSTSADGTQSNGPATVFNDALTGTTSTELYESTTNGAFTTGNGTAADAARAAPDPDNVRNLLDGVFATASEDDSAGEENRERTTSTNVTLVNGGTPIQPAELPRDDARPGMLPPRRRATWPVRSRRTPHSGQPRQRARFRDRARARVPSADQLWRVKPSKGSAGVMVALLLALLFGVIAVAFVSSFLGMFAGIGS